jgi:hypothetical protein
VLTGVAVMTVYVGAALLGLAPLVAPKVTFVNPTTWRASSKRARSSRVSSRREE